ncbi:adenylate/guanylate cyclase domain-containing protein [Sneathiella sp.]|uniref:adenylate/guanylate cyclase domain-containing protein n=1 Tax=Sneathiella sp. TaxID=1964365 RepID=UPI003565ABF7
MMIHPSVKILLQRIVKPPEGVSKDTAHILAVAKIGFPIALVDHFIFLVIFWHLNVSVMMYFNMASVVLWAVGIWFLYARNVVRATFIPLVLIEIPAHALLATVYFGLGPAFYSYLLISIAITYLATFFERQTRIMVSLCYMALIVLLGLFVYAADPLHELPENWQTFFFIFNTVGAAAVVAIVVGLYEWIATAAEAELTIEFDRAEGLLRNILPDAIAAKLKDSSELIAEEHNQVTVLFADIVDFTQTSSRLTAAELVTNLNRIFSRFDDLVAKYNVEKIKTIGDAYMVVAGLPAARDDHANVMILLALDMIDAAAEINEDSDIPLKIRIGINSGPVIAGVIGHKKFAYDLWGDTVNVAARMEELGRPDEIQLTQTTRDLLGDAYRYQDLGMITVKGKGELQAFMIVGGNPSPI